MGNIFKRIFGGEPKNIEPDYPQAFGQKTVWLAVKADDPISVVHKLKLKILSEINWKDGLSAVNKSTYDKLRIFVSPVLDGYVLVIGVIYLSPDEIRKRANKLGEFQHFSSHIAGDFYTWAKFNDGEIVHAYGYSRIQKMRLRGLRFTLSPFQNDYSSIWKEGEITEEELALGFDKFPSKEKELLEGDVVVPTEEDVLNIAKAWGIDPRFENHTYEKSTGYLCRMR